MLVFDLNSKGLESAEFEYYRAWSDTLTEWDSQADDESYQDL